MLGAAAFQTIRNGAQRSLIRTAGTLPATFVRFVYGLPFAVLGFAVVDRLWGGTLPPVGLVFLGWNLLGAIAQLAATAFLLAAMEQRSFVVGVAFSKTEVLQIALYSVVLLAEPVHVATLVAILLATIGVILLSIKAGTGTHAQAWVSPAAVFGLASGASFAISAIGYRAAALALGDVPPWVAGPYALVWAQAAQSLLLGTYLAARDRTGLRQVIAQWRVSLLAGLMGASASSLWFTAFAMRSAADVRTVGLSEVVFSYAASRRFFKEPVSGRELTGIVLIAAGILVISTMA